MLLSGRVRDTVSIVGRHTTHLEKMIVMRAEGRGLPSMTHKGLLQSGGKGPSHPKETMAESMNGPIHERRKANGRRQMKRCSHSLGVRENANKADNEISQRGI